jgi:hypothetical protein
MDIKLVIILFILYLLVQTQKFNKIVLSKIHNTMNDNNEPNNYGKVVQGIIFIIMYIIIISLNDHNVI